MSSKYSISKKTIIIWTGKQNYIYKKSSHSFYFHHLRTIGSWLLLIRAFLVGLLVRPLIRANRLFVPCSKNKWKINTMHRSRDFTLYQIHWNDLQVTDCHCLSSLTPLQHLHCNNWSVPDALPPCLYWNDAHLSYDGECAFHLQLL